VEQKDTGSAAPGGPRIRILANGPYIVSGGVPLTDQIVCLDDYGQPRGWREGRSYPVPESYALCRCGRSQQMPFCDGSHTAGRFDGTESAADTPYLAQAEEITGPALTLTDAESFCIGAGFCDRAGGTWALTRRSDVPQARQTAIEEACDCPSGRLVAWDRDGRAIEPDFEPSLGLVVSETDEGPDRTDGVGPLWVRGGIPVESSDGTVYEVRNRMTLCRCGRSSNKPFCDGSHSH
jgi:CDGSH-type Zn-finger protein